MVDTFRGQLRVRKWPKKRGTSKNPLVVRQNDWFRDMNRLLKFAAPRQQVVAIETTKRSGLYPRDLLMMAASEGLFDIQEPGVGIIRKRRFGVQKVAFQGIRTSLLANVPVPANVATPLTWTLPSIDTSGMWDVSAPDFLTVPENVDIMEFSGGYDFTGGVATDTAMWVQGPGGIVICRDDRRGTFNSRGTFSSGPLIVTPGDQYRFFAFSQLANTVRKTSNTYFAASIGQALVA